MKFSTRKHWRFGQNRKCISIETSGFTVTPSIYLEVDGGEGDFCIHLGFFIGIWLTFTDFLPNSWYPQDKSATYGNLPGERTLSLKFHHWALWWCFWKDDDSWSRGDSRLRSGSFDFLRLIKGKHNCEFKELKKEMHVISMIEGNYSVEVIQQLRIDSWERWPTRNMITYEVKAGYYEEDKFIEVPIPVEGKGENSWDCDEDATFSSSFSGKHRKLNTCVDAAMYFEHSMKKDRIRRARPGWLPKRFNEVRIIRKLQIVK